MPVIDPQLVAILAIAACTMALMLAVALVVLALRLRVARKVVSRMERRTVGSGDHDIGAMLELHRGEVARVSNEMARLDSDSVELREALRGSLSRIAVVRYDAFEDMGGALSFSVALLDDRRHGMVLSAINGRTETRCYAKPIVDGTSEHTLSEEEDEAITAAIEGRLTAAPDTGRRRRRAS